jgi:sterol desaturase/sphingolipid hydroxylase (fatty acid hydroxylase superfamily)
MSSKYSGRASARGIRLTETRPPRAGAKLGHAGRGRTRERAASDRLGEWTTRTNGEEDSCGAEPISLSHRSQLPRPYDDGIELRDTMPDLRNEQRRRAHLALQTSEAMSLGHGFISGLMSALLGIAGLGLVLGLRFPEFVGFGELRPLYHSPYFRAAIHVTLVTSFLLGTVSAFLRANKALALTGIGFTLVASVLGGSRVGVGGAIEGQSSWVAVDFFVLNLLLYSAVFVPLERLFALRAGQPVFRRHWLVDLSYFFVNSLLVEVLTILTLTPALVLFDWARVASIERTVSALPLVAQVFAMVLVADLTQYWVHRTFHVVPVLWRFHAIHHSVEEMDWLAGSRLHLVDVILTRGLTYVPIFVLGFSKPALMVYVFLVAAQATFIHANVRWEFRPLRRLVATPAFHHWHHSADQEAVDKNFAVHTPLWDLLFGTYYLPSHWPTQYGLARRAVVPVGWVKQLLYPFGRRSQNEP